MPLYDFQCRQCGNKMELLIRTTMERESPVCESCGSSELERLISAPNIAREKTGARTTRCGNTTPCCGSSQPCDNPPCG